MALRLASPGYFQAIVRSPDKLREVLEDFFLVTETPTPVGLAAWLGTTVPRLRAFLTDPAGATREFTEEVVDLLTSALTNVEAFLTDRGLTEGLNPVFTKFILSSSLSRNERTEVADQRVTRLEISYASSSDSPTPQDLVEMERLRALTDAHALQVPEAPKAPEVNPQDVHEEICLAEF